MNPRKRVATFQEFQLEDPDAASRWDALINGSPESDTYHRAAYIVASAQLELSQPLGLQVSYDHQHYLLPMLLRPISGPNREPWSDASTPYGYGGVIRLNSGTVAPETSELFRGLRDWCRTRKLASCVLRSHPLLMQEWLFDGAAKCDFVTVTRRGQTTAVPLDRWDDLRHCPATLSKGRRSDLAFARRHLRVTWSVPSDRSDSLQQFQIFHALYESTMQRLNATAFFHFPWSYFERLARLGSDVGVAIAWHGTCAVGGAVFMAGRSFAHYHLSANDDAGQRFKASTLLVVEGANWARQHGCGTLHLGGGMLVNDSLMTFKRSFGGEKREFAHITLIGDHERYDSMCSMAAPLWPYDQKLTTRMKDLNTEPRLRVILMGKDKPVVRKGLDYLMKNGFCVVAVIGPDNGAPTGRRLVDIAARHGLPTTTDKHLYDVLEGRSSPDSLPFSLDGIDLVISLLYWKRIRKPLIQLPIIACINFHPAPLPEFRGIGGYNVAVLENLTYWGAAVHFVDETFDTGDLIGVRRFDIDASRETAFSLEQRTQEVLFELFRETMDTLKNGRKLQGQPQGKGRYISKEEFERLRHIQPDDSAETIARKVRAFWYPPNGGAAIHINGKEYTVIDDEMLARLVKRSS